jgi:hypothetical protein
MITVGVFFYHEILPPLIDRGVSDSKSLAKRFENTDERFNEINITLNEIRSDIKSLSDARFLSSALKDATSGDETTLTRRLPDANRLLHQVRSMRVPLSAKEYTDISKPLLSHYSSAKAPLKEQLWETLVGIANARSSTDAIVHPLYQSDIDKAQTAGKYFEAVEVDLSSATQWEGAIFRACKIKISKPENELTLKDVRFVECDFSSMPENESSRMFLSTLLSNGNSEVSGTVAHFGSLPPVYKHKQTTRD